MRRLTHPQCVPSYCHSKALRILANLSLLVFILAAAPSLSAQTCEDIPDRGSESITAELSINGTTNKVANGAILAPYTVLRIDSVASAFGSCIGMAWNSGSCEPTGYVYERNINHTNVWVDISTNTGLNGAYSVGHVWGTTSDLHVLDTKSSDSTGPNYLQLPYPGTYKIHIQGIINGTPCSMTPLETQDLILTVHVGLNMNCGTTDCEQNIGPPVSKGQPVNVTNGNMYIQYTDFRLPGIGDDLQITRTYNSANQVDGWFGFGWSSFLDESVTTYGTQLLRLNLSDGRAVYFARPDTASPYVAQGQLGFYGQAVKNVDNSYTIAFKDGRIHQFNPAGKLLSLTDRNGNTITVTLDANGKPTAITDASGRVITITYDGYDRIGTLSDSLGTIATYTHSFWGRLTRVTYADGSQFNYADTFIGNYILVTSVTDALGNVLELHEYDSEGRATTSEVAGNGTEKYTFNYISAAETDVTDALNHVTKYFFDTGKGRNVVTRIEGNCSCGGGSQVRTWTYDDVGNVTAKTDALNHTTSYTYDSNGNRLTETDATGTVTYTYNSLGEVLTLTDQMSGVWTKTYDSDGNLLTVKNPLNHTTTLTYDNQGQLETATDPRNNTTTLTYDSNGNLTRRTDAQTNQTNIAYDARGRVTSVTNALSEITSYEYDLAGRLKKVIYPDTNFVQFTYDLAGRRTKIKDPRGYETNFAYDAAYRLTSETNADNKTTTYAYDLMSNLTGVTDALNRTTNYFYDEFDRLTKIKYPEATAGAGRKEENFAYDLAGNLLSRTDQAGKVTSFCYDSADRITSSTDPALKVTSYEYNARSQQTAVVDAINNRYEFGFDALGHVTQEKKGTATKSFVYDAAGNPSQRTDYNSAVTNYTYDALNRLATISYPDSTSATYGYDVLSRMTTATNPNGTVTTAYDHRSRISSVTDVFGQVVSYSYDANSNRTQLSLNAAANATYQYDVLNRLSQLTDSGSLNTTFAYDATNKLTSRTLPNGVVSAYQYDDLNRLTRLTYAKGANTLADFQYQFNAVNNITQMIDGSGTNSYSYDSLDRLTSATHPAGQTNESYTYDDVGNRTASHLGSTYNYQPFNRLVAANGSSLGFDLNGNLNSKIDGSVSWTFNWDYENRLKQASASGGVTVDYSYDALGRRIQRADNISGTTKFVYDGIDPLRDLDGGGSTIVDYLNGLGIDDKLRETMGGTASYILKDHLGTTRNLADSSGNITTSLSYDSFGNLSSGSLSTRFGYTGREFDADTDLYYYRARFYDPELGRFISEDPIGFEGGYNWYGYVLQNPMNLNDPYGLKIWVCSRRTKPPLTPTGANHAYFFDDRNNQSCGLSGTPPWMHGSTDPERGINGDTCRPVDGSDDPGKADQIMNCCKNYRGWTWIPGVSDCHNLTHSCITMADLKDPGAPGGRFGERCVKCNRPTPSPKPGSDQSPKCWGGARGC